MNRATLFDALDIVLDGAPKRDVMKVLQGSRYELSRSASQEYWTVCLRLIGKISEASHRNHDGCQAAYNRFAEMRERDSDRQTLAKGEFPARIRKELERVAARKLDL